VSVYEYLRAPKFYAQWGAKEVQGSTWGGSHDPDLLRSLGPPKTFEEFLSFLLHQRSINYTKPMLARRGSPRDSHSYRSPWIWLDSQIASYAFLNMCLNGTGPAGLLHLENIAVELPLIVGPEFAGLDLHVDQLNKTTDPTHPDWHDYWQTPKARALAVRLGIDREAAALGYPGGPDVR
jgi:hypothetical protein